MKTWVCEGPDVWRLEDTSLKYIEIYFEEPDIGDSNYQVEVWHDDNNAISIYFQPNSFSPCRAIRIC